MSHLLRTELRDAWRALWHRPAATAVAVLTLGLGVGANTAIFSVFESILLSPLPYSQPSRLVSVAQVDAAGGHGVSAWVANEWTSSGAIVDAVGLYTDGQMVLTGDGEPEVFRGQRVNADFFETLGVYPLLGRLFTAEDDRPPRAAVVVLSHDLWTRRFGQDPSVVGRTLTLNSQAYRVIGVLDRTFIPLRMSNPAEEPRIFAPLGYDPRAELTCRNCPDFAAIARLAPYVTLDRARQGLTASIRRLHNDYPGDFGEDDGVRVEPLGRQMTAALAPALWIALGAALFVLLIACANLANIQLVRATARQGEFAVRGALGASGSTLARQMLIEGLLIAVIGCVAGLVLGRLSIDALIALAPRELPRLGEITLDRRVTIVACAAGVLTAMLAALGPAVLAARADLNDALKNAAARIAGGRTTRLRAGLVVGGIAFAFLLVTATGLLVRTVSGLLGVDAGFDAAHVLTLTPVPSRGLSPQGMLERHRRIVESIAAIPGVTAASLINEVPLARTTRIPCEIEGVAKDTVGSIGPGVYWVEGNYFAALRIPLRRGRLLTPHDGPDAPAVVVSESFARRRFAGADAIGRRLRLDVEPHENTWLTIVGIVGDVRNVGLDRAPDEAVYQPLAMNPFHYVRVVARTTGDPWSVDRAIRAAIHSVDPLTAMFHDQPMDGYVASSMAQRRFALSLMTAFGVLALILAAIGLYAVLAYTVAMRTAELGIRAALGATRGNLVSLVAAQAIRLTAAGTTAGVLLAAASTRLLASLLFGVTALDALTFAAAVAIIGLSGIGAACIPALRAARTDPLIAMRDSG